MNTTNMTQFKMTTSTPRQQHRIIESDDIVVLGAYGVIALTSLLGNGITISIIVRNATFHTLYNFLLLNLAAADFVSGLLSILQLTYIIGFDSQSGEIFCKIFTGIIYCNIAVSMSTLTAIAVERYYGIVKPLLHRNNMTNKRLKLTLVFMWLWSAVTAAVIAREIHLDETKRLYCFVSANESDWPTWKLALGWFALITIFVTPLVGITFLYTKIVIHFKKANNSAVSENTNNSAIARKRSAKTIKLLIIITFLFAITTIPELVYFGLVFYDRKYVDASLFFKIGIPAVGNIAINPFVYTLSNPTFRQEVKRQFLCRSTGETTVNVRETISSRSVNTARRTGRN